MSNEKPVKKKSSMVTVLYHKSNVVSFQLDKTQPLFRLVGGTNHIPSDIWALMKKDSILNGKIESGLIEEVGGSEEGGSASDVYASLKPKARRDVISNETSEENLKSYLEVEKNGELQKLIEKQLEIVSADPQFRENK